MERTPEASPSETPEVRAGRELLRPRVSVTRGLDDVIDVERGVLPFDFAIRQLASLATESLAETAPPGEPAEVYTLFRNRGLSHAQVAELARAAI